jgi:hypothetical protein
MSEMKGADEIIARWAAVKAAIQAERRRISVEYMKARNSIISRCGQDIQQLVFVKSLLIHENPAVYVGCDGDVRVCVEDVVMTNVSRLELSSHWPGRLGEWEGILSVLGKVNADVIISAWAEATK